MKLIGTVLGFEIGTGNDNDTTMETDPRPPPTTTTTKKESDTSAKTNGQTKNVKSEQNPVIDFFIFIETVFFMKF